MRLNRRIWFTALSGIALVAIAPAVAQTLPGVVIEAVSPGSEAQRADLQPGDVVQSWTRSDATGTVGSCFDLPQIETEQASRGAVVLKGFRGDTPRVWTLGPADWGIESRPNLPQKALSLYREGQSLVDSGNSDQAAERWKLAIQEVTSANPSRLLAEFSFVAAMHLGKQKMWRESDEMFSRALQGAEPAEAAVRVQILRSWAQAFVQRADQANAQKYYQRALQESEKSGSENLIFADILDGLGFAAARQGDLANAEKHFARALEIQRVQAPDSLALARSLSGMGFLAWLRGDLAKAQENFDRALAIRKKLAPESLDVAASLGNMGLVASDSGDLAKAEQDYRAALAIYERLSPDSLELARNLANLGMVVCSRGDLAKCEEYYLKALAIREQLAPGSLDVAGSYTSLGIVSWKRGDFDKAEEYYGKALDIKRKLAPKGIDIAPGLTNLGLLADDRGDLVKAEKYFREALSIQEKKNPGSLAEAETLTNLADVLLERGNLAQAEAEHRLALGIRMKQAPGILAVAENLSGLGSVFLRRGNLAQAEKYFAQALAVQKKISSEIANSETLSAMAEVKKREHDLDSAVSFSKQAVDALESQTAELGGSEEVRSDFRARYLRFYQQYSELLIQRNQPELAFQVTERSRARAFLQLLAERDLVFAADLPAEIQSARRENALSYNNVQSAMASLDASKDDAKIHELAGQLRELEGEREQIVERIRQTSPRLAALQYPEPLDVSAAREVLDPGLVLVSYSIGEKSSLVFVLKPHDVNPGFAAVSLPVGETVLRQRVTALRKAIEGMDRHSQEEFRLQSSQLYNMLLRPIEKLIAPAQRIVICPDAPLHELPFAALLRSKDQFLVEWKPLHITLSATVYAELKKRRHEDHYGEQLVAFGDPLYPASKQADAIRAGNNGFRGDVERGFAFVPLPYSKVEVNEIAELFPQHSQIFLAEQATEGRAKQVSKDVQYLHFATHAVVDERLPLNSALALTITENSTQGQEDGLLQAWEIFEQVRIDANLVTLSACDTGLGKEMNGEGLIGLTRAFQYAGAHSVLASLWSIPDVSTAEFMKRFYGYLTSGKSKDEALRQAQMDFLRLPQFRRPFYWAAFSLNGDWQ